MDKPFFSIVVPVFQTEPFLEQCLRSIKQQSFTNFECIVVNDGSPGVDPVDFTKHQDPGYKPQVKIEGVSRIKQIEYIFSEVVGDDSKFSLISQLNAGVSASRNHAVRLSQGKWLVNIDSDDWVTSNYLQNFFNSLNQIENEAFPVVFYRFSEFYNTANPIKFFKPKKITLANTVHTSIFYSVNSAFNLDLIGRHNLSYDERLGRGSKLEHRVSSGGEDFMFGFQYLNAVVQDFGENFKVIEIPGGEYKYREFGYDQKKAEDFNGPYSYAKYFQEIGLKHPDRKVRFVSRVLPFWVKLRTSPNKIIRLFGRGFSLFMRLITDCY
ncbi:MAG: hypothetical protein OHK0017_05850 [Patescibacteria group bacterium]